jgi:hypothetical protein
LALHRFILIFLLDWDLAGGKLVVINNRAGSRYFPQGKLFAIGHFTGQDGICRPVFYVLSQPFLAVTISQPFELTHLKVSS